MIKKKYLTKKIYAYEQWWELVKVYSPNKWEDHLLLKRETNSVHADGTPSCEYTLVMDGNDDWLPNCVTTRELSAKYVKLMREDSPQGKVLKQMRELNMEIWDDKPEDVKW